MLRRALEWLAGHFDADADPDTGDEDTGFVPSLLDRSVRYAHGGNDSGKRELAHIRERAETLEEQRRRE